MRQAIPHGVCWVGKGTRVWRVAHLLEISQQAFSSKRPRAAYFRAATSLSHTGAAGATRRAPMRLPSGPAPAWQAGWTRC